MKNLKTFFVISGILLLFATARAGETTANKDPNAEKALGANEASEGTSTATLPAGDKCSNCLDPKNVGAFPLVREKPRDYTHLFNPNEPTGDLNPKDHAN